MICLSKGPNINFFSHNTPIGMIIVRIYDMQVVHISIYQIVQFTFLENMVVTMEGLRSSIAFRMQRIIGTGST